MNKNTPEIKTCISCLQEKHISEFKPEHVLLQSLGGNSSNNPFISYAFCERCNNVAGFHIDAPFIKHPLVKNGKANSDWTLINSKEPKAVSLSYTGILEEWVYEDNVCDCYLGPCGEEIFHFHKPYPVEPDIPYMAGIPPHLKKKVDEGFVFITMKSNNQFWLYVAVLSVIEEFENSILYSSNCPGIEHKRFHEIPPHLHNLRDRIVNMAGKRRNQKFIVPYASDHRFMAKFALGMGSIFLSEDFATSPDADLLRNFMREKNSEKRSEVPIKGVGLFGEKVGLETMKDFLRIEHCHVVYLYPTSEELVLYANFYGSFYNIINVTNNPSHWRDKIPENGLVYVIIPTEKKFIGPIHATHVIAHNQNLQYIPDVALFEDKVRNWKRPPFEVEN